MILKLMPIAAALLIGGTAHAQDKGKLNSLIERSIKAGRSVVEEAGKDPRADRQDRADLQGQFALMLIKAGKCAEAERFIGEHADARASTISRVINAAIPRNRDCALPLARHMLARWDDPAYDPIGRIGARFRASAYLDQIGDAGAWEALRAADAEMQRMDDARGRWSIRFDGQGAYPEGAKLQRYLEFLAERMKAEKLSPSDGTFLGITAVFAYHDRCDLVAAVTQPGPHSCDEARRNADSMYRTPASPAMQKVAAEMRAARPLPNEDSLREAMASPGRWGRLTQLLFLVESCKRALAEAG